MQDNTIVRGSLNPTTRHSGHRHALMPHNWVELYGGKIVEILPGQPEPWSFRDEYYYNSTENVLYRRIARWVAIDRNVECEDADYIDYEGVRVPALLSQPHPMHFGHDLYYNLGSKQLFRRSIRWVNHMTDHHYVNDRVRGICRGVDSKHGLSWVVPLSDGGMRYPVVDVYDGEDLLIMPNNGHQLAGAALELYFGLPEYSQTVRLGNPSVVSGYPDALQVSLLTPDYLHRQDSDSSSWVINHNLNTRNVSFTIYDGDGELVGPDEVSVSVIDENQILADFIGPESGYFSVAAGGYLHEQITPLASWNVHHNLGTDRISVRLFDNTGKQFYCESVELVDENNVSIFFSSSVSGWVSIVVESVA